MKYLATSSLLLILLLSACADGTGGTDSIGGGGGLDFNSFVRSVFADDANSQPREVSGLQFDQQEIGNDDFSDLLQ
jgi:hypothetical protein